MDLSGVTAITIPEGSVTQIEDSNGNVLWKKVTRVDLIATCVNKGWRNHSNQISGNGTDPNWAWGEPIEINGQTKISCRIDGYTTVSTFMFYTASMGIISWVSASSVEYTDEPIPANAKYIAVCCHNLTKYPNQWGFME